jgi:phage terminase large subunit-like protein
MRAPLNGQLFGALADTLSSDWRRLARPSQRMPEGNWIIWLILAGRGFGKSRTGAETVRLQKLAGYRNIGLIGATAADVRDVMIEGPSGLLTISPKLDRPLYEPSKRRLTWSNGAIATAYSADEPDRLRGPAHDFIWADELAAWNDPNAWDMLMFGLRMGKNPRALVTTTPRPTKIIRGLIAREGKDVVVTRGSTHENAANLAPAFLNEIMNKYQGTRLGRQEIMAEVLSDTPGALWTMDLIDKGRRPSVEFPVIPTMRRVVVALDPAITVTEKADETGIVVAGLGVDDHGCVLADESGKYSPIEWARKAVALYRSWGADRIIAEANQGGPMVETTVRTVDQNVSFKAVRASRGKITRAEPIAALAEQFRIHLIGAFPHLEDQLCSYAAGSSGSPDLLDAMTWAFTELMLDASGNTGFLGFYREQYEAMYASPGPAPAPIAINHQGGLSLRCPRESANTIICGISRKEYTPVDGVITDVLIEDAACLRRNGFVDVAEETSTSC